MIKNRIRKDTIVRNKQKGWLHRFYIWVLFMTAVFQAGYFGFVGRAYAAAFQIPENTKIIEDEAFYGSSLITEITLPDGIETIGNKAFADTGITEVSFPDGIKSIASDAFEGSALCDVIAKKGTIGYKWAIANGYWVNHIYTYDIETESSDAIIPFETIYVDDDTMYVDDPEVVVSIGKEGVLSVVWTITYYDGEEIKREKTTDVTTAAVNTVIRRGTKEHVVTYQAETTTEAISAGVEYVSDPNRYVDDPETTNAEGKDGVKTIHWNAKYIDGQRASAEKTGEEVTSAPVAKQVSKGTKEHVYTSSTYTETEVIAKTTTVERSNLTNFNYTKEEGHDGLKEITYRIDYKDGKETGRTKVSESIVTAMVPRVEVQTTLTKTYEFIECDLPGAKGQRTLDDEAKEWVMGMAESGNVGHSGDGTRSESVGSFYEDPDSIGQKLYDHSPCVGEDDNYGIAVVKVTYWDEDGNYWGEDYIGGAIGR